MGAEAVGWGAEIVGEAVVGWAKAVDMGIGAEAADGGAETYHLCYLILSVIITWLSDCIIKTSPYMTVFCITIRTNWLHFRTCSNSLVIVYDNLKDKSILIPSYTYQKWGMILK